MKQLTQRLKDGTMQVLEVPMPMFGPGMVMVKNYFSLISTGTESSTVTAARKSLLGKAKERPQQVKQVLDVVVQQGPLQAYRAVMKKLDAWSPLGYSTAGIVVEAAPDVAGFSVGDRVACAGAGYANHAEMVAVPANLCVKLPPGADLKSAAYNTLGAIALQGVRQADLCLGESSVVIGLGLIGQLTCLLLRAAGVRVAGIDKNPAMVDIAKRHCADLALNTDEAGLSERVEGFTGGIGADAVIITAASDSTGPVNLAGQMARKKGRVVVVGSVPTGFDRDPHYYRKELELRMSCSYGPGRYDPAYEEKGIDYPVGYVRWTENRNMQAFQECIHSGKIDLAYLTTHVFALEDAPAAYDLILKREEPFLGILIRYGTGAVEQEQQHVHSGRVSLRSAGPVGRVNIAFVGAGSYAQSHLLPNIPREGDVVLKTVMTASGTTSRSVAERFGFESCTADDNDIFAHDVEKGLDSRFRGNDNRSGNGDGFINTVFIATRHNTHASYVIKALMAGRHCFCEKPLCLREEELTEIAALYGGLAPSPALMVGFNRRFAPLAVRLREKIGGGPMAMLYRVNAGAIPADSWIQDREVGGGRIVGEVCHFVDFMTFLNGSLPATVSAQALPDPDGLQDTVQVGLTFANGAVGTIVYVANGAKGVAKEYIEVHRNGMTGILRDFKELEVYGGGAATFRKRLFAQDKGQKEMVRAFVGAVKEGRPAPIPFEEIHAVTMATFKILESLRKRMVVEI